MFRSSTFIRELALNLAKVIFILKHSVELRRYLLCSCVAACCHTTAYRLKKSVTEVGHFMQKHSVQCTTSVICLAHTGASLLRSLNEVAVTFSF